MRFTIFAEDSMLARFTDVEFDWIEDFYKSLEQRPDPQLDAIVSKILPFSLRCFCAQVICKNKIPFQRALPPALQNFVVKHGAKL